MAISKALFSSKNNNWQTPQDLFDNLNKEYKFVMDLAASKENHKCPQYWTEEDDSLGKDWHKTKGYQWCNPPYGRGIIRWVKKAYEENLLGARIVMLLPARIDTKWFCKHAFNHAAKICPIEGRLKFLDEDGKVMYDKKGNEQSAPFPSIVVVYEGRKIEVSEWHLLNKQGLIIN